MCNTGYDQTNLWIECPQHDPPDGVLLVALVGVGVLLLGLDGVDRDYLVINII